MLIEFLYGAYNTLLIALIAWIIGLPFGIGLSFISFKFFTYSSYLKVTSISVTIMPFLAILFWLHYPLQKLLNVVWPPFNTATFLLTFYVTVVSGDILAEEMRKIKDDYIDSADVLGIDEKIFFKRIVFPTGFKKSISRLLSLSIVSIHMTMFASLIGVEELFRVTLRINAEYLQPVKVFTIMALIYAVICIPLYYFAYALRKKSLT